MIKIDDFPRTGHEQKPTFPDDKEQMIERSSQRTNNIRGTNDQGSRSKNINKFLLLSVLLIFVFVIVAFKIGIIGRNDEEIDKKKLENSKQAQIPLSDVISAHNKEHLKEGPIFIQELNFNKQLSKQVKYQPKYPPNRVQQSTFPKILWVLTSMQEQALDTVSAILRNSIIHMGKISGFQTRIVNTWTAHDYLSPQMLEAITNTTQAKRARVNIFQIMRLALLIEHGGVVVEIGRTVLIEPLDWLLEIFQKKEGKLKDNFTCKGLEDPDFFIFSYNDSTILRNTYYSDILAARPNSTFLRRILLDMMHSIVQGRWIYNKLINIQGQDHVNATVFNYFLEKTISANILFYSHIQKKSFQQFCKSSKIQSLNVGYQFNKISENCSRANQYFWRDRIENQVSCSKDRFWLKFTGDKLQSKIVNILKDQNISLVDPNSIIAQNIFQGENYQYIVPYQTLREVHFCIYSFNQVARAQINLITESLEALKNQDFKSWTAVYMTKESRQMNEPIQAGQKVIIANSRGNKGLNAQYAFVKYCPPQSIIFLLDVHQRLKDDDSLSKIAEKLKYRKIYGAFLSLQFQQKLYNATIAPNFHRRDYLVHPMKFQMPSYIYNHFRVFHSDMYKILPKMELYFPENGKYIETRLQYQMLVLEFGRNQKIQDNNYFHYERARRWFDVPGQAVNLQDVIIKTNNYQKLNFQKVKQIEAKHAARSLQELVNYHTWPQERLEHVFVFNDGEQPPGYQLRKDKPKIIPKILHQVWIGGPMPPIKAYISKMVREMYPDYQYNLWGVANITPQAFPFTHRIIKSVLAIQKTSFYPRQAMTADLIRYEVLYKYGGFYFDINYQILKKTLDDWRTYKLIFGAQQPMKHRIMATMCFIGVMPQYPLFMRILLPNNTNRYDYFTLNGDFAIGPVNFLRLVRGQEEYDKDILLLPYEYLSHTLQGYQKQNLCLVPPDTPGVVAVEKEQGLVKNCSEKYPIMIAREHYQIGNSWLVKKSS